MKPQTRNSMYSSMSQCVPTCFASVFNMLNTIIVYIECGNESKEQVGVTTLRFI